MADRVFVAEFDSFAELVDGCASRISEEGIFLETTQPGPVGSEMAFEVRVRGSFSVLRGEGEIIRASQEGVFLRLVYLDQPSLKLLPKLVEHYRRLGVPPLELPEVDAVESAETVASPAAELDLVDEPTADDLWPAEDKTAPAPPMGITLDDLEAEFLTEKERADEDEESAVGVGTQAGVELVEATAFPIQDEVAEEQALDAGTDIDSEIEPETARDEVASPLLVDPEDLIADLAGDREALVADDIHLDELLTADTTTGQEDNEEVLEVDSGLPWLPDEPEKKSGKDLWVFLLLIVLGAVLGVVVYFFFLRPEATDSRESPEPAEVQARMLPAAAPAAEPMPMAATAADPPLAVGTAIAPESATPSEPVPVAPGARSPDPLADLLTGVDRITWAQDAGETVITFWGNGLFVADQVDDFRVAGGEPREVVRIRGIDRPFAQQQIELDTDHVWRIRVGLHEEVDGAALHFVADLVDGNVELSRTEAAGEQLRVYFSKAG